MKNVADWIRSQTPGWTDEERYKTISFWHNLLQPGAILGFVFGGPIIRFCILVLLSITILTQVAYRDCLIYLVEQEFCKKKMTSIISYIVKSLGLYTIRQPEKILFTAGLNTGVLIMFIILLLQESMLWLVAFTAVVFIVPLVLALSSTILPPLKTYELRPLNVRVSPDGPSFSQTPPRVSEKKDSTDETE